MTDTPTSPGTQAPVPSLAIGNPKDIIAIEGTDKPFPPGVTGQGEPVIGGDGKPLMGSDGKPVVGGRALVRHRDGTSEIYYFDYNHPPTFDIASHDFGRGPVVGPVDTKIEGEWQQAQRMAANPRTITIKGKDGSTQVVTRNPQTNEYEPVYNSGPTAPPKTSVHVDSSGAVMIVDETTGQGHYVTYPDGTIVTDPAKVLANAAAIGLNTEQINQLRSQIGINQRKLELEENQQGFNQGQTQFQNAQTIQQNARKEGQDALSTYLDLNVNLPRNEASDERAAQTSRVAQALNALQGANYRENVANTAGQNAVTDAQWMASHTATPAFSAMLGQIGATPGLQPNFGIPGLGAPMPDLNAIRGQAQQQIFSRMPDFNTALAQAGSAYPVFHPDQNQIYDYLSQMWPTMNIWTPAPPRPRGYPPVQTDLGFGPQVPYPYPDPSYASAE